SEPFWITLIAVSSSAARGARANTSVQLSWCNSIEGAGLALVPQRGGAPKPRDRVEQHTERENMCEDGLPILPYPMTPSRRSLMLFTASAAGMLLGGRIAGAMEATAPPKPDNLLTPDASLKRLMERNARFVQGLSRLDDFRQER